MFEKILICLSSFRIYVFITVVVSLILYIIINFLASKFSVKKKKLMFLGLFYGLSNRNIIRLSVIYLKLMFVIISIVAYRQLEIYHYIFFILLLLIFHLLKFKISDFLLAFLNATMICIGLLVENMLIDYTQLIRFKLTYLLMYILFGVLIISYSIYLFILEVGKSLVKRG